MLEDLKDKLLKVLDFFAPANSWKYNLDVDYSAAAHLPGDIALLVIDVQKEFCDPAGHRGNKITERTSKRIKELVPEFRKAGVPVYAVYFSERPLKKEDIDFYQFEPENSDALIAKNANSAFQGSEIEDILRKHNRKTLLTCGFNLDACVHYTAIDARKLGFDVQVIRDLSGNGKTNSHGKKATKYIREMIKQGVEITTSRKALERLQTVNAANTAVSEPVA